MKDSILKVGWHHHPYSGFWPWHVWKVQLILLMVQKSGVYQLRLVLVYPIFHQGFIYTSQVVFSPALNKEQVYTSGTWCESKLESLSFLGPRGCMRFSGASCLFVSGRLYQCIWNALCISIICLPSAFKLTWQWKSTFPNWKYIYKWWIFHCYVCLPECIYLIAANHAGEYDHYVHPFTPAFPPLPREIAGGE